MFAIIVTDPAENHYIVGPFETEDLAWDYVGEHENVITT